MEGVDWSQQAQFMDKWRAVVYVIMNIWDPYNVGNFLTNWGTVSFSRRYALCRVGWLLTNVFMEEDRKLNDHSSSPRSCQLQCQGGTKAL
jgi:hypothetical protein